MRPLLVIALLFFSLVGFADRESYEADNGIAHGLGIGGTVHRTWGFLYRQYFESNFGIAASAGGWFYRGVGHLGAAFGTSYTFGHHHFPRSNFPSSSIRVYAIAYAAALYQKDALDLGLGVGPGAEYFFTKNFALHIELPWMTFFQIKEKKFSFDRSYPNFGGGLSYYF